MGVTKRKDGLYRAYKKIGGAQYQYYFYCVFQANKKQNELDKMALLYEHTKPKKLFTKEGTLFGFNLSMRKKKTAKTTSIHMAKRLYPTGLVKPDLGQCTGTLQQMWLWAYREWSVYNKLKTKQLHDLRHEIKIAKSLYTTKHLQMLKYKEIQDAQY